MADGSCAVPGGGGGRIVLMIDNLTVLVAELKEAGTQFRNEILVGPGGSQILCEDSSGNAIELFQP